MDGAPILIEIATSLSLAMLLVLLVLGTDELVQLFNLLSVELDILEEQVHLVEAIDGSRVLHHV